MGWDSFGMPAENAAKQNNLNPKKWTENNIEVMKSQLKNLDFQLIGIEKFLTCSSEYHKHQQKIFLELYDKGLVYRKESYVKLGSSRQNCFANEQVIDGKVGDLGQKSREKNLINGFLKYLIFRRAIIRSGQIGRLTLKKLKHAKTG